MFLETDWLQFMRRHTHVPNCVPHVSAVKLRRCERKTKGGSLLERHFRRRQNTMNTGQTPKMGPSIFMGRWTPKILFSLKEKPYRYWQLRRQLGSISQRMLTRTLRNLESAGLVARIVTESKAIAVEYSLTQLGRTIIAPLAGMCRWAKRYRKDVSAEVRLRGAEIG